jgi:23S rRNA (pseudouridine1915-N3)-methyltransferase
MVNDMLDIKIISIGKLKDKANAALVSEYLKRLKPYAKVEIIELEAAPFSESSRLKAKEIEGVRLENALKRYPERQTYLLAERGKIFDSPGFASFLEEETPLNLLIAGALGFNDRLYASYPAISLSPLTFPHELARVVLLEQIYRATTIINGKSYHY